MDLYYKVSLIGSDKVNYLHIFSGEHQQEYVVIDKSYFEFGKPNQNFQKVGEKIFMGSAKTETQEELKHMLIDLILSDELDFGQERHIKRNEL